MIGTPAALATLPTWYTAVAWPRPTAHTCTPFFYLLHLLQGLSMLYVLPILYELCLNFPHLANQSMLHL